MHCELVNSQMDKSSRLVKLKRRHLKILESCCSRNVNADRDLRIFSPVDMGISVRKFGDVCVLIWALKVVSVGTRGELEVLFWATAA